MSTGTSTEIDQDHTSALKLWRAVISQAVLDSISEKKFLRLSVTRWLFNPDFETVCELAGLSPVVIKRCLAEILKENGSIRGEVLGREMIARIEVV